MPNRPNAPRFTGPMIPAGEPVRTAVAAIFGRSRFTASELALRVGRDLSAFWRWFRDRDLPVPVARKTAMVLNDWAAELLESARQLNALADQYDPLIPRVTPSEPSTRPVALVADTPASPVTPAVPPTGIQIDLPPDRVATGL
jgi:hypothetical protein